MERKRIQSMFRGMLRARVFEGRAEEVYSKGSYAILLRHLPESVICFVGDGAVNQGATFYLSNLGVFPFVQSFDALVPLGAAAILALGAEHNENCQFTLSCDHRVVSGTDSARFLTTLQDYLQKPEVLLV